MNKSEPSEGEVIIMASSPREFAEELIGYRNAFGYAVASHYKNKRYVAYEGVTVDDIVNAINAEATNDKKAIKKFHVDRATYYEHKYKTLRKHFDYITDNCLTDAYEKMVGSNRTDAQKAVDVVKMRSYTLGKYTELDRMVKFVVPALVILVAVVAIVNVVL